MTSLQASPRRLRRARLPLMALGMAALFGASWGGLLRLGWALPSVHLSLASFHGPLMVSGFLGTVIGMERAVALGRRWAYAAPLATGLGALTLLVGMPATAGALLMTLGSAGLIVVFVAILRRQWGLTSSSRARAGEGTARAGSLVQFERSPRGTMVLTKLALTRARATRAGFGGG